VIPSHVQSCGVSVFFHLFVKAGGRFPFQSCCCAALFSDRRVAKRRRTCTLVCAFGLSSPHNMLLVAVPLARLELCYFDVYYSHDAMSMHMYVRKQGDKVRDSSNKANKKTNDTTTCSAVTLSVTHTVFGCSLWRGANRFSDQFEVALHFLLALVAWLRSGNMHSSLLSCHRVVCIPVRRHAKHM